MTPAAPSRTEGPVVEGTATGTAPAGRGLPPLLRAVLAGLVLACLVLVAGCSGGSGAAAVVPPPNPADAIRQAFVTTRDAGTARVALASRTSAAGQPLDVTGDGVLQLATGAADLGIDLPSLGGRVRVLSTGGTVYAALPPGITSFLGGGKPWVAVDLARLSGASGPLAGLGGGLTTDPAQQLAYLQGVRDDARVVGPEPVDGVATTHYAGTIDLDRVPAASDPAARPALDRLEAQLGSSTLPVEVWVDEQGRLRRVLQTVRTTTTTVTFSDYGVPAPVDPPPADQVADVSSLLPR